MRLLNVITSADPAGGGVIEAVRQFGVAQQAAGHHVEVVSVDGPNGFDASNFPLPLTRLGPSVGGFAYNSKLVPWLYKNAERFDAIIVNGIWQYPSMAVRRCAQLTGAPYFIFPHGMLDPWFQRAYPLKHIKKTIFWKLFQARSFAEARSVLFTCEEERLLARKSFAPYRCREAVAGLGIKAPGGDAAAQRELFLRKFPELKGKRVLLFLGRIHPKKGCDLLIRAFAKVAGGAADMRLVMAGPDQTGWMGELKALAVRLGMADRIAWPGMLEGDLKWGAFHASEAFVLPSHQENFGIAVVEALACGLPVLISKQVNIWREIAGDRAGLADEDTQEGTDRLIEGWLGLSEGARMAMQAQTRRTFLERFEINRAAEKMIEVLKASLP